MKNLVNAQKVESILESYTGQSCYGVQSLINNWAYAKKDLFNFFDGKLSIEREFSEHLPDDEVLTLLHNLYSDLFQLDLFGTDYRGEFFKIVHTITAEELINNKCIEERPTIPSYKIGMKLSKFLRMQVIDIPNFGEIKGKIKSSRELFDIKWSMFNQSLTFNGIMVISIDPCDILTMSINKYDWDSCHDLEDGCHKAGSLSYISDHHSAVAFVLKDKTEYNYNFEAYSHTSKKWRQMVYINLDTMVSIHCRQYTADNENAAKVSRQLMADQFSKHFNISNDCKVSRNLDLARELIEDCDPVNHNGSHSNQLHYNDVLLTSHEISIITMKESTKDRKTSIMTIGSNSVTCPVCGDHELTKADELQCDYCLGGAYTCSHCGDRTNEDNLMSDNNGNHYCESCHNELFSYCESCEEYEYNENGQYLESEGIWVCDDCLRRNYTECSHCGEYINDNDIIDHNNNNYCQSCHDELFAYCDHCEEYHRHENTTYYNGETLCFSCYDEVIEAEENEEQEEDAE